MSDKWRTSSRFTGQEMFVVGKAEKFSIVKSKDVKITGYKSDHTNRKLDYTIRKPDHTNGELIVGR